MHNHIPFIYINGDGNIIGNGNVVTITKQYFTGEYERLRDAYIDPSQIFDRVDLDHFVGREWLLAEVDAFLRDHDRGYFILEAEAGMGKSTFLAWLVQTRGYIQHFCELAPGPGGVEIGLKSLTAQLALACHLGVGDVEGMLPTAARRPDYFYSVLSLAAQSRKPGERIVLVIDALDTADTPPGQNTLALPRGLPRGVFVITSQRPTTVTLQVDDATTPREVLRLSDRQAENRADMRGFLEAAVEWPSVRRALQAGHVDAAWLIKTLPEKCGGVWIYLHFLIHEIERGKRPVAQLDSLPGGIIQYYAAAWRRQRDEDENAWDEAYLPLLAALAAAPEAVPAERLIAWGNVPARWHEEIRRRLNIGWRPFITVVREGAQVRYQFYHTTLREFFAGEVEWDELTTDEVEFILELRLAVGVSHGRVVEDYLRKCEGAWFEIDDYGRKHLWFHTVNYVGRPALLERGLTDYEIRYLGDHIAGSADWEMLGRAVGKSFELKRRDTSQSSSSKE